MMEFSDFPDGTPVIPKDAKIITKGVIPVYLPDRSVIGKATISEDGHTVLMHIDSETITELIGEDLIGMSFVYKTNEARDRVAEGDKKDG